MKAKKSFGQHFLTDDVLSNKIAQHITQDTSYELLLEVGPGKGALTKHLMNLSEKTFFAVEADKDMVRFLERKYPEWKGLLPMDFLKLDFNALFGRRSIGLVGNFPYNISSQIVFKMLDNKDRIPIMIGMFQREMGRRIISPPGSKDYGVISVLTQAFYSGEKLFDVPPASFNPAPKVHSQVILLRRNNRKALPCDYSRFKAIVKTSFNQRRKMLRNSLKAISPNLENVPHELLTMRPEQLSVEDFIRITQALT